MMIELMKGIDFIDHTVLDFGTGTGILAILAERSGAEKIYAIDNDDWSIENAAENFRKNNCKKIILQKVSDARLDKKFDVILANINKNVILQSLDVLKEQLNDRGTLLVSGLLETDKNDILQKIEELKLNFHKCLIRNNWIAIQLSK
jgi:ribosomal protein L11 methyltransferase